MRFVFRNLFFQLCQDQRYPAYSNLFVNRKAGSRTDRLVVDKYPVFRPAKQSFVLNEQGDCFVKGFGHDMVSCTRSD